MEASNPSPRWGRIHPLLGFALSAGMLLAACGGAAAPTSSAAPASSSAPSSSAAASSAPASAASSAAASSSASASASSSGAATGTPIKIGVLDDLTGGGSIEGAEQKINVDLAVAQINAAGGINGHPLATTIVDSKGDAATAAQMATQLAQQDKVDVLVGGVYSAECLGVQKEISTLGIVYMPLNACANEPFTSTACNNLTFRVFPVGKQTIDPGIGYLVKSYGKKWAIMVPQNPFGDSQVAATVASLKAAGGSMALTIKIPVGEANVTPFVTKIPTDGSINGIFNDENGTDLARVVAVMQQFGISKLPQAMALGAESFGGVYPAAANGAVLTRLTLTKPPASDTFANAYLSAFKGQLAKEGQVANVLGGAKGIPGDLGYESYATMETLKLAMIKSGFTGRADTAKLIQAIDGINVTQATAEFPYGGMVMNPNDHQGKMPLDILKVNGQNEQILSQVPLSQVPNIGNCKIPAAS